MIINEILNIDCKIGFQAIPDESIDLCVTDPPYKVISGGKPKKKGQPSGMLSKNDGKIFDHNDIEFEEWLPEVYRVLKSDTQCYIFTNTINLEEMLRLSREIGFGLHSVLIWKKNNVTPSRWYMKNAEYILFLRKGRAFTINNKGSKTVLEYDNVRNKLHPTQKPIDLLNELITNSSQENQIILDPFMGAGSTAIAALKCNRRFVGFEIDKEYYEIGTEQIKKELNINDN